MKEWSFFEIVRALVTLLALTNRILVVCYVILLEKHFVCFFSNLCLTLEFFLFVVFTIYFNLD